MHPEHLDDIIRRSDDHVGAEPDENRPDAVADPVQGLYDLRAANTDRRPLHDSVPFWTKDDDFVLHDSREERWDARLNDEGFIELWFGRGSEWRYKGCYNTDDAVMLAHAILSEVETATRKDQQ